MNPKEIFNFLEKDVLGQQEVLQYVSVAIFKHLQGEPFGNLMMIGNSGTGKTTVMRAMERLYRSHQDFEKYRVVIVMNANTFSTEEGIIDLSTFFLRLEERAKKVLGPDATAEQVGSFMEHATVCLDEMDKCSGVVGGKPYITGINIQQALLTLIEGQEVDHLVTLEKNGSTTREPVTLHTGKMLFLCAGAFETLYDQVFERVTSPTSRVKLPTETIFLDGEVQIREYFTLRHHFRQEDLFDFGMQPQFLSRFDNSIILEDLNADLLKKIFLEPDDAVFRLSKNFFGKLGIDLDISDDAAWRVANEAAKHQRIGARALKAVYGKVIKPYEYDPYENAHVTKVGDRHSLIITEEIVNHALRPAYELLT
jgi:ATP-dependent Clp protease ATP-binding subunit ClpX